MSEENEAKISTFLICWPCILVYHTFKVHMGRWEHSRLQTRAKTTPQNSQKPLKRILKSMNWNRNQIKSYFCKLVIPTHTLTCSFRFAGAALEELRHKGAKKYPSKTIKNFQKRFENRKWCKNELFFLHAEHPYMLTWGSGFIWVALDESRLKEPPKQ